MSDIAYQAVMARKNEIMKRAVGIDYGIFEFGKLGFDYEGMMEKAAYPMDEMQRIQAETKVGNTPLYELKNINRMIRKYAPQGKGARIFMKDEAANASDNGITIQLLILGEEECNNQCHECGNPECAVRYGAEGEGGKDNQGDEYDEGNEGNPLASVKL